MKKYKLMEYSSGNVCERGVFETLEETQDRQLKLQEKSKECFYRIEEVEESIMDRVRTYEDAREIMGRRENEVFDLPGHIKALLKLETITAALNEGWKPRVGSCFQKKYVVYLNDGNMVVDYLSEKSICPPTLYLKSQELADYASKQFEGLYKQYFFLKDDTNSYHD